MEKTTVFPQWSGSKGKGMNKIQHEKKPLVSNFIAQRERRRVGQTLPRFSPRSGQGRHGGYREGRHLHLLCPQQSPLSSSTPRGHPGGGAQEDGRAGGEAGGGGGAGGNSAKPDRAGRAASPGAAPGSRLRARPDPAAAAAGTRAPARRGRPPAHNSGPGSHPARGPPPPAMSAAAGCRQSGCRPGRRWLQSAAIILCSLRAAARLWGSGGGSIFTAAPPAMGRPRARVSGASPSPLRPPGSLRLLPPPPAPLTGGTSSSVTAFVRGPDLAGVLFSPPRNTPRQTTPPPRHSPTLRFSQPPGPQAAAAAAD